MRRSAVFPLELIIEIYGKWPKLTDQRSRITLQSVPICMVRHFPWRIIRVQMSRTRKIPKKSSTRYLHIVICVVGHKLNGVLYAQHSHFRSRDKCRKQKWRRWSSWYESYKRKINRLRLIIILFFYLNALTIFICSDKKQRENTTLKAENQQLRQNQQQAERQKLQSQVEDESTLHIMFKLLFSNSICLFFIF